MSNFQLRIFFILTGIISLLTLIIFSHWVFPFTTDSIFYITTAQQITLGKGLLYKNVFVNIAPEYTPNSLNPPGYPILIALLSLTGLNAYTAGLLIPRFFFLLLPFLMFVICKRLMPQRASLVASVIGTFTFGMITCSLMAWSDVPYLFFSLLSIGMVFQIIEQGGESNLGFILLAGIILGVTYLTRYIGLTLMASVGLVWLACLILKVFSLRNFLRASIIYGSGVALAVIPYLIRNKVVFGSFLSYTSPKQPSSFLVNAQDYLRELSHMIFTIPFFDKAVLGIIILTAGLFLAQSKSWIRENKKKFAFNLLIFSYFMIYSLFFIMFKSIYYAPEAINERYLIPVEWILMAGIIWIISVGLSSLNKFQPIDVQAIAGLMVLSFILIQIFPATDFCFFQKRIKDYSAKIEHYVPLVCNLPPEYVVVTNVSDLTYLLCPRDVRALSWFTPYGVAAYLGAKRKCAVFISKENELLSSSSQYAPTWTDPSQVGYRKTFSDPNVDLFLFSAR